MGGFSRRLLLRSLLAAATWVSQARGDCECGYAVNETGVSTHAVFTDLIESNFRTIPNITEDTDWKVQKYYKPPYDQHLGRNCTLGNVVSNPLSDNNSVTSNGKLGGDAGLQLWVRGGQPADGMVPSGEMRTVRNDLLYGSVRAALKLTPVNGTCSAMFSYFNDSQEIDIEMLSRQYMNSTEASSPIAPLNLVLHSLAALEAGHQTPNSSSYGVPELGGDIDLSADFHEYRFDWLPGVVSFYFDGRWIWDLRDDDVPRFPSSILMSHWSNGAHGWSQGPPTEDAVMTIAYFQAYFNSSDPQRHSDYGARCRDPNAPNAICSIPDGFAAGTGTQKPFFFSQQLNHTTNQTVYNGVDSSMAPTSYRGVYGLAIFAGVATLIVSSIV